MLLFFVLNEGHCYSQEQIEITPTRFEARQKCFNSSDGVMRYVDEGNGEAILLLHGVPTSGWLYRAMIDKLVDANFRVIVPDMLGFGNSAAPNGPSLYSPANHAKRLLQLMNALEIENWSQVVHDAGSVWTFELMKKAPNRITSITFLNAVLAENGVNWSNRVDVGFLPTIGRFLYQIGLKQHPPVTKMIKKNTSKSALSKNELAGYAKMFANGKNEAAKAHYCYMENYISNFPASTVFNNIKTQVIWGEADDVLQWNPQADLITEKFNIKEENIHLFPVNHYITEDLPFETSQLLINFIDTK